MIRLLDIIIAFFALLLLSPLFVLIALVIKISSEGAVLFKQIRVGKNDADFVLYKFRTMYVNAQKLGRLTFSHDDARITKAGYYLRKWKLDELPQLFNVLKGDMSMVGPRPELRYYVNKYNDAQKKVLTTKPGITDYASIRFRNENELLSKSVNPETEYVSKIMPLKIELNNYYIHNKSVALYFHILVKTLYSIIKS